VDGRARAREKTAVSRDEAGEEGRETRSDGKGGGQGDGGGQPQHREPSYWNLNNNYSV